MGLEADPGAASEVEGDIGSATTVPVEESELAAFRLATIDVPTTGQIEGYKHLRTQ
jgi:hypothetical protein